MEFVKLWQYQTQGCAVIQNIITCMQSTQGFVCGGVYVGVLANMALSGPEYVSANRVRTFWLVLTFLHNVSTKFCCSDASSSASPFHTVADNGQ